MSTVVDARRRPAWRGAAPWLGALALGCVAWLALASPAGAAIKPRALTHLTGFNGYPAWTPDGQRVAFASGREATVRRVTLWITSADTDTASAVTWGDWDDAYPAFSPDGKSMLYMSNRDGEYNLYMKLFDPDTTWAVGDTARTNLYPRWFRDGRRILFASAHDSTEGIYVQDLATGAATCLLTSRQVIYHPVLSPDEKEVYFSWVQNKLLFDIYRMPVTGGQPKPWCQMPGMKMSPVFTPDGGHILFARSNERGIYELWVAPVGAPLTAHKVQTGLANSYYPAFSPDGKRLAFCSKDETGGVDVWIAPWPPEEVDAR